MRMATDAAAPVLVQVTEAIGGRPSGPGGVREGLGVAFAAVNQDAALFRAVVEASTYDEVIAEFAGQVFDQLVAAVADRIEKHGTRRRAASSTATASVLVTMAVHAAYRQLAFDTGMDETELVDALADVWIAAVYGAM